MFKDNIILSELNRIANQLSLSDSSITFRGKVYAVTPENMQQDLTNILYS